MTPSHLSAPSLQAPLVSQPSAISNHYILRPILSNLRLRLFMPNLLPYRGYQVYRTPSPHYNNKLCYYNPRMKCWGTRRKAQGQRKSYSWRQGTNESYQRCYPPVWAAIRSCMSINVHPWVISTAPHVTHRQWCGKLMIEQQGFWLCDQCGCGWGWHCGVWLGVNGASLDMPISYLSSLILIWCH